MSQAPFMTKATNRKANLEIEVKLACNNLDDLLRAGFDLKLLTPRHFEDNWLLDLPDQSLSRNGAALRVRTVNGSGLVTFKGTVSQSNYSKLKVREEIETEVADPERLISLFERLGYQRSFRYQKYRTEYLLVIDKSELEVVFDETPMGNFIEIEGDEGAVLQVLSAAGFSTEQSIRESYPELQAARCRERGVALEDLVF
jgi:adenylate cyclase class 2